MRLYLPPSTANFPGSHFWIYFFFTPLFLSFSFLFSRQVLSLMVGLGFGFFWVLFAFWLFVDRGVWIYVVNPILLIFSLFGFSAIFSITVGKREQARLFQLFGTVAQHFDQARFVQNGVGIGLTHQAGDATRHSR